jgi:hypothetical protein
VSELLSTEEKNADAVRALAAAQRLEEDDAELAAYAHVTSRPSNDHKVCRARVVCDELCCIDLTLFYVDSWTMMMMMMRTTMAMICRWAVTMPKPVKIADERKCRALALRRWSAFSNRAMTKRMVCFVVDRRPSPIFVTQCVCR